MNLRGVAHYRPKIRGDVVFELDRFGKRLLDHLRDVAGEMLHLGQPEFTRGAVRKTEDLLHEAGAPGSAALQRPEDFQIARRAQALAQHRRGKDDRGEHVVEIMRDAGSEHAEALEPLRMEKLFEELL